MRPECIKAVTQAIGRTLTKPEIENIEQGLIRSMRGLARKDPVAWAGLSNADRLHEAAKIAATELVGDQQKKQQRTALAVLAHDRMQRHITDQGTKGVGGLDALDAAVAFDSDLEGNFMSAESRANAIGADSLRQMIGTLEASNPKWFGLFENKEGVQAIIKEIFNEPSGIKEAADGAKQWSEVTGALKERFNRGGGDVGTREDWGMPHHHGQLAVAKAGRDQWMADYLPMAQRARAKGEFVNLDGDPMSDTELNEFIGRAWTTIATGGANKIELGKFSGNGARANRGNQERQLHFANADDYMHYQEKYGERSLYEVLIGHIENVSKDIALVETFGPNPDNAYRFFRDQAARDAKLADPVKTGKIDERVVKSDNLYNIVAGKSLPVASEALAKSFDTLRNWLVASRLGSSVITSFSDDATLHLTAKLNNLPAMQTLANELAALNPANRMEERLANRAGLGLRTMVSSLNRFGQGPMRAGFSKNLAGAVLRASGLNALTEARRRGFGVTMMSSIGSVTKRYASLKNIDPGDHRVLLSKGVTETDFQVWKLAQQEDWGGGNKTMLTPESIYRIPDAGLKPLGDPTRLREQAATKLLGAVLEETDVAIIEPGAKERAMTGAGLQRGTWKGELTKSFFLFKSFPLAMINRHWERGMSMPNQGGRAAYIATLMAATTVLGMASLQVNEVLSGRDPKNMNPFGKGGTRNWISAMLKGGSLGIYGDFLFSEATQHGQSPLASFAGPVAGLGESVFNLTQGNMMEFARGDKTHVGAETVKFVKGNTPGASLWYAKAALDHMVYNQLAEYFSPGYLAKVRARSQKEFGQRYYWEPQDALPGRAPDLGATVQ